MKYLVDTNVFSELTKPEPDPSALKWFQENLPNLFISTITIGELRYVIGRLPEGKRKTALQRWLIDLARTMEGNTLSFNRSVAYIWGDLRASLKSRGVALPHEDGMIAAIAKRHQLTVATRNLKDFQNTGVRVYNPFEASV